MSHNLPSVQSTSQLFTHFETTHQQVIDMIQRIHDLCDDKTEEGQTLMAELEVVAEQATAGYEDVKVLRFRNSVMEQTIQEINQRQADQLRRIEALEGMVTSPHATARHHERSRDKRNTELFNHIMKSAQQQARR